MQLTLSMLQPWTVGSGYIGGVVSQTGCPEHPSEHMWTAMSHAMCRIALLPCRLPCVRHFGLQISEAKCRSTPTSWKSAWTQPILPSDSDRFMDLDGFRWCTIIVQRIFGAYLNYLKLSWLLISSPSAQPQTVGDRLRCARLAEQLAPLVWASGSHCNGIWRHVKNSINGVFHLYFLLAPNNCQDFFTTIWTRMNLCFYIRLFFTFI